jgi:hypothetical protein
VHLVQLLLPLRDNQGEPFPRETVDAVLAELTARFGGVTAYLRSPASGAWLDEGQVDHDQLVMVEVMCQTLDRPWWARYRSGLETRFRQESLMVRATQVEPL